MVYMQMLQCYLLSILVKKKKSNHSLQSYLNKNKKNHFPSRDSKSWIYFPNWLMLFHLFLNVIFLGKGIVLLNVKEEIFPKSYALIGWFEPNQIALWRGMGEARKGVICHTGFLAIAKELLCNASLPNLLATIKLFPPYACTYTP